MAAAIRHTQCLLRGVANSELVTEQTYSLVVALRRSAVVTIRWLSVRNTSARQTKSGRAVHMCSLSNQDQYASRVANVVAIGSL